MGLPAATARERATELLRDALSRYTAGLEGVPRSVAASIVNEIIAAVDDDRNGTLAELAEAAMNLDAQISKLVRIAALHNVGVFAEAEAVIEELEKERRG